MRATPTVRCGRRRGQAAPVTEGRIADETHPDLLTITPERVDGQAGVLVLTVVGEIDLSTSGVLRHQLSHNLGRLVTPRSGVVLDLTGVTFLDARGLGVLLEARGWTRTRGLAFYLVCGASRAVLRALDASNLAEVFSQADDMTTAAGLSAQPPVAGDPRIGSDGSGAGSVGYRAPRTDSSAEGGRRPR